MQKNDIDYLRTIVSVLQIMIAGLSFAFSGMNLAEAAMAFRSADYAQVVFYIVMAVWLFVMGIYNANMAIKAFMKLR